MSERDYEEEKEEVVEDSLGPSVEEIGVMAV